MITIYKYALPSMHNEIRLPVGAEILSAGVQDREIFIWAKVNTDVEEEELIFEVFGTGNRVDNSYGKLKFLQTVFQGDFVWHVFQRIDDPR